MQFSEVVICALGFRGSVPIGRAEPAGGIWRVEIFHKATGIRAQSRREARLLLAVHGADRVEMIHQVKATWPEGIASPYAAFLPRGSTLLREGRFAGPVDQCDAEHRSDQKNLSGSNVWAKTWIPAFRPS